MGNTHVAKINKITPSKAGIEEVRLRRLHYVCFLFFKPWLIRETYTERRRLAPEYMGSNTHIPTHTADDSYKYHRTRVRSDSYTISNRRTPSGQSRVYRVTQLRTDGVHCREPTGTGPVNLKVVPKECCLSRSSCLSFLHPLLV